MRYEHLSLDVSGATLHTIAEMIRYCRAHIPFNFGTHSNSFVAAELDNLENEMRSRLQRTDSDPQAKPTNTDLVV